MEHPSKSYKPANDTGQIESQGYSPLKLLIGTVCLTGAVKDYSLEDTHDAVV